MRPHLRIVRDDRLRLSPEILPRAMWLGRLAAFAVGLGIAMLAFGVAAALAVAIGGRP